MSTVNRKDFRFYIGIPSPKYGNAVAYTEVETPKNWNNIKLNYARSKKSPEVSRKWTTPLAFYGRGARLIRELGLIHGDTLINLPTIKIEQLGAGFVYETFFTGQLDIPNIQYKEDVLECGIIDYSKQQRLIDAEKTVYEIEPTKETILAKLDGVGTKATVVTSSDTNLTNQSYNTGKYIIIGQVTPSSDDDQSASGSVGVFETYEKTSLQETTDFNIKSNQDNQVVTFSLSGRLGLWTFDIRDEVVNYVFSYSILSSTNTVRKTVQLMSGFSNETGAIITSTSAITESLSNGEKIVIYLQLNKPWNPKPSITFNYSYTASVQSTTSSVTTPYNVLVSLLEKITGDTWIYNTTTDQNNINRAYQVSDSPLYGETFLASGSWLRDSDTNKINVSLLDLKTFLFVHHCILLKFDYDNNKIKTINIRPNVFKETELADVGAIVNPEVLISKEYLHKSIKCGSGKYTYEVANGTEDFNNDIEFVYGELLEGVVYDLSTKIRTDIFGVDQARKEGLSDTEDNEEDNSLFALCLKSNAGFYIPDRTWYYDQTDIPKPYNVIYSPQYQLVNHRGNYAGCVAMNPNLKLEMAQSEKSNTFISYTPNASLNRPDLLQKEYSANYKPVLIKIDCYPIENFVTLLSSDNENKYITFTYKDIEFKGWIIEVEQGVTVKDKATFTLLSHKDNDLTKLFK